MVRGVKVGERVVADGCVGAHVVIHWQPPLVATTIPFFPRVTLVQTIQLLEMICINYLGLFNDLMANKMSTASFQVYPYHMQGGDWVSGTKRGSGVRMTMEANKGWKLGLGFPLLV